MAERDLSSSSLSNLCFRRGLADDKVNAGPESPHTFHSCPNFLIPLKNDLKQISFAKQI